MKIAMKKILLVDDDPLVLKSLKKAVELNGYEVIPAGGYDDACEAIRNADFDLVLSDIRMPNKNGVETVEAIQSALLKAGKRDLPIIFITGYSGDEAKLNAEFYGETLYKPVDLEKLLITIREYL